MQHDDCITLEHPLLAALYQRCAPTLFAHLQRKVASREDAEDLLLEVFLAALEHADFAAMSVKEQESWLWSVARNKLVDSYRRAARRPGVRLDLVADDLYERDEYAPEQVTLRREEYARLRASIEQLPELQQELLRLRFANDLHCAEIATVLQRSEGAVRMLLSRTMKMLRGIYDKDARGRDDAR